MTKRGADNYKTIIIAAGVSILVFALVAILTVSGMLDGLNRTVADAAYSSETPGLTAALKITSNASQWYAYVPIVLLLFVIPKTRWTAGIPAAATLAVAGTLNWTLKQVFAIPRPDTHRLVEASGFGFPSGHAMNGTAFVGICVLLLVRRSRNRSLKVIVAILATLFMLAVGFSRLYLGVHNLTDIVAGYAMGLGLGLIALRLTDAIQRRKSTEIVVRP